ncbi:DNA polymerase/3'-5' exonuclease PolX [Bacteroidota bacterium]
MKNSELIKILNNVSILLELKGENPFKSRAYSNAAEIIANEDIDIEQAVKEDRLKDIKGFGKALVSKITDYVKNGKMEYYESLTSEIPESLISLTKLSNLGPKKVRQIWQELGITTMEELEMACKNGTLIKLKGFAEKTVEMILNSIDHKKASKGRHLQYAVKNESKEILSFLKSLPMVKQAEITGDVRRFTETITGLHFLVAADSSNIIKYKIINSNLNLIEEKSKKQEIENELFFKTKQDIPVTIEIVEEDEFIFALHITSGTDEYLLEFEKLSTQKKIDYNKISLSSEEDLYRCLNLQYVPPELRESRIAFEASKAHQIPKLIEKSGLKGMIHVHSNWTDGHNSIEEMALKSKEMGFSYMALCDHSKSAVYANGLSPERVIKQHEEIDRFNNKEQGIKIIKGIESDILADGSLDYDEETLKSFEIIIASIHSGFRLNKKDMTKRIITALKNPFTTMLGHPTGRLLLVRPGYELDIKQIIDCAADYGKIIEINCNPYRLDLSWQNVIYAKEKGVKIAISPDSHRTKSLEDVWIGVDVARKGWLEAKNVVNCLDLHTFNNSYSSM